MGSKRRVDIDLLSEYAIVTVARERVSQGAKFQAVQCALTREFMHVDPLTKPLL
jgi:hypothetical protein